MKDLIFKLVFENDGKNFIAYIRQLIKPNMDFGFSINGFSAGGFEYTRTVDVMLEIEDMEGNGGYAGCSFDGEGLKDILIDSMYEDGNQYQKWVYERE